MGVNFLKMSNKKGFNLFFKLNLANIYASTWSDTHVVPNAKINTHPTLIHIEQMLQPHFGLSVKMKLTLPKVGTWSSLGLPKTQSSIAGAKNPRIGVFFIPWKRS